ncbi:hypothetical protein ACFSY7_11380 [Kurthia populi]|uniref:Uncharacterized protein n=1 Tax=Kurthia populi TaxID=1562132 RepID=A0ABW5Y1B1_9BACL
MKIEGGRLYEETLARYECFNHRNDLCCGHVVKIRAADANRTSGS